MYHTLYSSSGSSSELESEESESEDEEEESEEGSEEESQSESEEESESESEEEEETQDKNKEDEEQDIEMEVEQQVDKDQEMTEKQGNKFKKLLEWYPCDLYFRPKYVVPLSPQTPKYILANFLSSLSVFPFENHKGNMHVYSLEILFNF